MSKNCVLASETPAIIMAVPAGTRSGDPVLSGGLIGVAETDRTEVVSGKQYGGVGVPDGCASVNVDGTFSLLVPEVVAANNTPIYITGVGPYTLTTVSTSNKLFGHTQHIVQRGALTGGTKVVDGATPLRVNVKLVRL